MTVHQLDWYRWKGLPHQHLRKPPTNIFVGLLNPESDPEFYMECIKIISSNLEDVLKSGPESKKKVLYINTCGWRREFGQFITQNIKDLLKPSFLIEMDPSAGDSRLNIIADKTECKKLKFVFKLPAEPSETASERRDMSWMSYFSSCLSQTINLRPVCVKWHQIALGVIGGHVVGENLIRVLNANIVCLCKVNSSDIMESGNLMTPRLLKKGAICKSIGFGIVRNVDMKNKTLHIMTPVMITNLSPVNAICKGEGQLPEAIIMNQAIEGVELPYTLQSSEPKPDGLKMIPKRTVMKFKH